tara:strand:- start:13188 stop:14003 length:816 start_codon:yes stop_codon:yes gene_type:complete
MRKVTNIINPNKDKPLREFIEDKYPHLEDVIYNASRSVGLRLLDIKSTDMGVCYGCDWGNMLIYASKNCYKIIGVENNQTKFDFIKQRIKEENLTNIDLVNSEIDDTDKSKHIFDFAILNASSTELYDINSNTRYPDILNKVFINLKKSGKIYFAVDNKMYYGSLFSAIWSFKNRRHTYSQVGYTKLLHDVGFKNIKTYAVFPNHEFPLKILPLFKNVNINYSPVYEQVSKRTFLERVIGRMKRYSDLIIFKKLKLFHLSPSFIFVAKPSS